MNLFFGDFGLLILTVGAILVLHSRRHRSRGDPPWPETGLLLLCALALARPYLGTSSHVDNLPGDTKTFLVQDVSGEFARQHPLRASGILGRAARERGCTDCEELRSEGPLWETLQLAYNKEPGYARCRFIALTDRALPKREVEGLVAFQAANDVEVEVLSLPTMAEGPRIESCVIRDAVLGLGDTLHADLRITGQPGPASFAAEAGGESVRAGALLLGETPLTLRLEHRVSSPGLQNLTLSIAQGEGPPRRADTLSRPFYVAGKRKVLVAAHDAHEVRYLASALESDLLSVSVIDTAEVPVTPAAMQDYDCLVLYDVPGIFGQDQCETIDHYVREDGGGLLFISGPRTFSVGAHQGTKLQRLLPVTPEIPKETEKMKVTLGLILDTSGSMAEMAQGQRKLDILARASHSAVESLERGVDEVGVLVFAGEARWLLPIRTYDASTAIGLKLSRLYPGGETQLLPALAKMRLGMEERNSPIRHVLAVTDGRTAGDARQFERSANQMRMLGITVSTVAVGPEANQDLLGSIAKLGGGAFYSVPRMEDVAGILTQDIQRHARSGLVEQPSKVEVVDSTLWQPALDPGSAPPLLGHLASRPGERATVHLECDDGLPLYVDVPRGLGRVGFFASDAGDRYAQLWVGKWNSFSAFWARIVRSLAMQRLEHYRGRMIDTLSARGIVITSPTTFRSVPSSFEILGSESEKILSTRTLHSLSPREIWVPLPQSLPSSIYTIRLGDEAQTALLSIVEDRPAGLPFAHATTDMVDALRPIPLGTPPEVLVPLRSRALSLLQLVLCLAVIGLVVHALFARR